MGTLAAGGKGTQSFSSKKLNADDANTYNECKNTKDITPLTTPPLHLSLASCDPHA